MAQGQGNRKDGVRPGSQGIAGFPGSPSLCGVPRWREGGMAGIATSSFRKVGAIILRIPELKLMSFEEKKIIKDSPYLFLGF